MGNKGNMDIYMGCFKNAADPNRLLPRPWTSASDLGSQNSPKRYDNVYYCSIKCSHLEKEFNIIIHTHSRGWAINNYGLRYISGKPIMGLSPSIA